MSRRCLIALASGVIALFSVGCSDPVVELRDASDGRDARPESTDIGDASERDVGVDSGDSGPVDSGAPDGGSPDTGVADTGSLDSGAADTGTTGASVVDVDFETGVPAFVDVGTATLTPSQGYAPLGRPGNVFGATFLRSLTGNVIVATISPLPAHTSISVDFLFAAIDSLDGEGAFPAGDYFRVDLDGTTIFREAFANATPAQVQTYLPPVPEIVLARRVDLGFSGPGSFYTDSAYDMSLDPIFHDLPHTASTAVILFTLEGAGVQSLDDESWAIDNLRVTTR